MRRQPSNEPPPTSRGRIQFVGAVIFTLLAVSIWVFINRQNIQEYVETQEKREIARIEIAKMKENIALLKRQQQSLAYNGVETEKQIRERLGMIKPGESVVYFVEDENTATSSTSSKTQETSPRSRGTTRTP